MIQAEPSVDGSFLVDKTGLCFPVIFLGCTLNCDRRDEDVGQQMWGM